MSRSSATSSLCTAVARTVDPPITLIVDPDDDLACLEQLRRLHARPYGQILCEPDPTATSAELARYLLEGLGKDSRSVPREQLWHQVDCHLRAEHVHDLAITRAHTLTFAALHDLADHAHDASVAVSLLVAAERPTAAIAQLLEARPHQTADLQQLIDRWRQAQPPTEPATVPAGHGSRAAVHTAGICINRRVLDHDPTLAFGETRPLQWAASVQRATALIDQTADPQLAAIIALSLVYRHPETIRQVNVGGVAANGTIAATSWTGPRAIPPGLAKALATQRDQQLRAGATPTAPLLPGIKGRRMSARAISQTLATLHAPRSLWHRASDECFDEPDLDGRTILHALNPIALFQPPGR